MAAAVAATLAARRASRRLGLILLVPTFLLTVGVVYCQMHYGVDALAGSGRGRVVTWALVVRLLNGESKREREVKSVSGDARKSVGETKPVNGRASASPAYVFLSPLTFFSRFYWTVSLPFMPSARCGRQ